MPGDSSVRPLDGLFSGDIELLAIPRLGEAWEAAERAVSSVLEAEHALRLSDLLALDRIQRSGRHGIRTNALARALGIPSNRLTYQLAGLQQCALIERSPHPEDGRGVVLRLTKDGRNTHRRVLTTYRRITRDRLAGIDAGRDGVRLMAAAAIVSGEAPVPADVSALLSALGVSSVEEGIAVARARSRRPR